MKLNIRQSKDYTNEFYVSVDDKLIGRYMRRDDGIYDYETYKGEVASIAVSATYAILMLLNASGLLEMDGEAFVNMQGRLS